MAALLISSSGSLGEDEKGQLWQGQEVCSRAVVVSHGL